MSERLLPVGKGSGLTDQIIVNQRFASYVTNPKCFVWCSTSIMAMHISQYCEVFDMKHLWSIWMHLNQLYVAKKYRLLWKLIVEAFASLSTWLSWYFDRDKYKLWFRSRRLTPFNQFVSHYCQSMTQLACDCHPFSTHRNLQSNGWNILFQILTTNCLTGHSYVGRWCLKSSSDRRFYWNFFFLS